jgi:hypothetical protein
MPSTAGQLGRRQGRAHGSRAPCARARIRPADKRSSVSALEQPEHEQREPHIDRARADRAERSVRLVLERASARLRILGLDTGGTSGDDGGDDGRRAAEHEGRQADSGRQRRKTRLSPALVDDCAAGRRCESQAEDRAAPTVLGVLALPPIRAHQYRAVATSETRGRSRYCVHGAATAARPGARDGLARGPTLRSASSDRAAPAALSQQRLAKPPRSRPRHGPQPTWRSPARSGATVRRPQAGAYLRMR